MGKLKKLLFLCVAAFILCAVSFTQVMAVQDDILLSANFDGLELENDGTGTGNTTYQAQNGSMWLSWQEKQPISAAAAPAPEKKKAGTSMTDAGETDKALKVEIQSGSAANSMFNTSLDSKTDYYAMEKLEFSFNLYMEKYTGGSHAPLQIDFRKDKNMVGSVIAFRSSGQIQTFPQGAAANVMAYQKQRWYHTKLEIDTKKRTYCLWIDGELAGKANAALANANLRFPGDPEATGENTMKEIRFSVNNGQKSTGSIVYLDDLYFGAVRPEVTEFTVSDLFFSDGENKIQVIPQEKKQIYAKASYLYSDQTQMQPLALTMAMYDGQGNLKKVWQKEETIAPSQIPGTQTGELVLEAQLIEGELVGDETFRLFLWNGLNAMCPLYNGKIEASVYQGESIGKNPIIYLASDSICVDYVNYNTSGDTQENYKWYPQQGWGHCLPEFFDGTVTVDNRAYGGLSTKTFENSGRWKAIMNTIREGDYVLISFGHNDQNSSSEDRYTTIAEYKENLCRFIDQARSKGANTVLITPVTMMGSGNSAENFDNKLLERSNAMKEVAQEKSVTLLDVNSATFKEFQEMGYEAARDAYFMSAKAVQNLIAEGKLTQEKIDNHPNSSFKTYKQDLTHLTETGAHYIAGKIAGLLKESKSPLKERLREEKTEENYQWLYRQTFEEQDAAGASLSRYKISAANTKTAAGETAMKAEIAAAPGQGQGNALKVVVNRTDSKGYPYLDLALSEQANEEPFVIDYKMWCQESITAHRKIGYRDENAASSVILMNYRATGEVKTETNQLIGSYPAGENMSKWVRYQLLVDLKQGGYTVYADGSKMGTGTVKTEGRLKSIRLTFENKDGSSDKPSVTYFDDIKVYKGTSLMPPELDVDRSLSGRVLYNRYPQGSNKAVTFSFDDGKKEDLKTVSTLNRYAMKGTFNLVPAWIGTNTFVTENEVKTGYSGHEIANHGNQHSRIESQSKDVFGADYLLGRENLTELTGSAVRGYVYPFGGITDKEEIPKITMEEVLDVLRQNGAAYARTTKEVTHFNLPSDFLRWDTQIRIGTGKKTESAMDMIDRFTAMETQSVPQVLMIWGHSHEINGYTLTGQEKTGWDLFEQMCEKLAGKEDIWYAANIEIADYQKAVSSLTVSEADKSISNPSELEVWVEADGTPVKIMPGETYTLTGKR